MPSHLVARLTWMIDHIRYFPVDKKESFANILL